MTHCSTLHWQISLKGIFFSFLTAKLFQSISWFFRLDNLALDGNETQDDQTNRSTHLILGNANILLRAKHPGNNCNKDVIYSVFDLYKNFLSSQKGGSTSNLLVNQT